MQEVKAFIQNNNFKLVGLTGGAGSGKSTLARMLNTVVYSMDSEFIGDSKFRSVLLEVKRNKSIDSYLDACNMFNWWNWDRVERDLFDLRCSGNKVIIEGAILGPVPVIDMLDCILFIHVDPQVRFTRLLERDGYKRSFKEAMHRFLITEYSENLFYKKMVELFPHKIYYLNSDFNFIVGKPPVIDDNQAVPLRMKI